MLIIQIAIGVILGGLVLMWLQQRAANKVKLRAALRKGQEAGQQIDKLVREQASTYLAGLQEELLTLLDQRIAILGFTDDTIEQQQARNRHEVQSLLESVGDVDKQVWQAVEHNLTDWIALVEQLDLRQFVDAIIQQCVAKWKEELILAAAERILVARQRLDAAGDE